MNHTPISTTDNPVNQAYPSLLILGGWLILTAGLVAYATRWGIGTSPDSAVYIGTADNLLRGQGLTIPFSDPPGRPLTFYPPLYPLFLAAGGLILGEPLTQAARWLHGGLLIGNLLVAWLFLKKMTPQPAWLPTLLLFPLAGGATLLTLHMMAWSEALFLLTGFAGLLLTAQGLFKNQPRLVVTGGLLLGLATLTRYSGLAFIAAAVLGGFLVKPGNLIKRIGNALWIGLPGLVLFLAWAVRNLLVSGNLANRSLEFHPLTRAHFNQALDTLAGWFLIPLTLPGIVKIGLLGLLAGLCLLILFRNRDRMQPLAWLLTRFMLVLALVYPAFLVVSISFVDANTPLDDRILAPLLVAFWLLIATAIGQSIPEATSQKRVFAIMIALAAILYTGVSGMSLATAIRSGHADGMGFLHKSWRESLVIAQIRSLPAEYIVYTNSVEAVYLLTNHPAVPLPRKIDLTRQQPNPNYYAAMEQLQNDLTRANTALAYFTVIRSPALPTFEEINALFPTIAGRFDAPDGHFIRVGGDN